MNTNTIWGGVAVWWWESDKTIKDALTRTGLKFLESKEEFERVHYEFEDDDNLFKDIPNARTQKGEAISRWCSENLKLPLSEDNVKKILPKAARYCMGSEKITSGTSEFRNFNNIVKLLKDSGVKSGSMSDCVMVHLGEEETKDVYYSLNGSCDLEQQSLKKSGSDNYWNRKFVTSRRIYVGKEHKLLGFTNEDMFKSSQKWDPIIKKFYTLSEGERMRGITDINGRLPMQDMHKFFTQCKLLLQKDFDVTKKEEMEDFRLSEKEVIDWCTEEGYKRKK